MRPTPSRIRLAASPRASRGQIALSARGQIHSFVPEDETSGPEDLAGHNCSVEGA